MDDRGPLPVRACAHRFGECGCGARRHGVLAVWTNHDLSADGVGHIPFPPLFKRADGSPMAAPLRTLLADGTVLYVGHPVAAIVAQTRVQAQDAAELLEIDYEELPCVIDPRKAILPGAPQVSAQVAGNISAEQRYGDAAAVTAAFAQAAHVTELELHNQRLIATALEPRCALAQFDGARWTLYTQTQQPTGTRDALAAVFKTPPERFRVVVGDIGGGFGMKTGLYPEDALACYAARKLGRPVKWRADRSEEFLATHMGRDQHFKARLALDAEGRILALRMEGLGNFGAVPVGSTAVIPLVLGPKVQTTVYHVPVIDYHLRGVLTNTMATGAYRGAGRPEGNYLMERLIEKAAREMSIDSVELRRRNLIQPGQFPYRTHLGETYDAGDFERMLDGVLEAADWSGYAARREESKRRGKLRGRGLAVYIEWTGALPTETVDIRVDADGEVTVFSGTQAMGQGLETSYMQLITEVLQIPAGKVTIVQGDTDQANGTGSVGSRSAFVGGSAVVAAGRKTIARGTELAGASAGIGGRRHRVPQRGVPHRGHRPVDRFVRTRGAAGRAADPRVGDRNTVFAVVAQRRAGLRARDRPGNGQRRAVGIYERRRHRADHQPHDRRRADPWRHRAGRRPGTVRTGGLR